MRFDQRYIEPTIGKGSLQSGSINHSKPRYLSSAAKDAHRRRFLAHLQIWAYGHYQRSTFRGWIAPAPDSNTFALGRPVLCLFTTSTDGPIFKAYLKLFKRQGRRGGVEAGVLEAVFKVGAGWVGETEFFEKLLPRKHKRMSVPACMSEPSDQTALKLGPGRRSLPNNTFATSEVWIPNNYKDWVALSSPFKLLALPKDIRLIIFEHMVSKPTEYIFDGERMGSLGRYLPQYLSKHQEFLSVSRTCRQLREEMNHWLYSTSEFVFQNRHACVQFLQTIGLSNRASLRFICLQFKHSDYLDVFTPTRLVNMMDTPIWHKDRNYLRTVLKHEMYLQQLTIRMLTVPTLAYDESCNEQLDPSIYWMIKSALSFQKSHLRTTRLALTSAHWPHRDLTQDYNADKYSWNSLIFATVDLTGQDNALQKWLKRPSLSLIKTLILSGRHKFLAPEVQTI